MTAQAALNIAAADIGYYAPDDPQPGRQPEWNTTILPRKGSSWRRPAAEKQLCETREEQS